MALIEAEGGQRMNINSVGNEYRTCLWDIHSLLLLLRLLVLVWFSSASFLCPRMLGNKFQSEVEHGAETNLALTINISLSFVNVVNILVLRC